MQGGKEGTRPYTAVLTKAEMKNFDRSVLGFFVNIPASRNRQPGQYVDYDAFVESWNADVKLEEEQAKKGLVLVHGHNLVNRKGSSRPPFSHERVQESHQLEANHEPVQSRIIGFEQVPSRVTSLRNVGRRRIYWRAAKRGSRGFPDSG